MQRQPNPPDLESLIALFYPNRNDLGVFQPVGSRDLPSPYKQLLDHDHHMTVSVEKFHNSQVDVQVLGVKTDENWYCRKILLATQDAGRSVVQFGIVRLNLEALEAHVREQILEQETPLGRVLIDNQVLRQVKLASLYRIECGDDLSFLLRTPPHEITYGRTALIYCNNEPAVELLEIVSPVGEREGND